METLATDHVYPEYDMWTQFVAQTLDTGLTVSRYALLIFEQEKKGETNSCNCLFHSWTHLTIHIQ